MPSVDKDPEEELYKLLRREKELKEKISALVEEIAILESKDGKGQGEREEDEDKDEGRIKYDRLDAL
jgi:hypothetical protein